MTYLSTGLLSAALFGVAFGAVAQPAGLPMAASAAETQQIDAQRLAINAQRQQLQSGYAAEDALCYERFAVNNCLQKVNARRMASMADLRRQDVLLNDQERKRRGAEEMSRIEAKQTAASQQDLADRRAKVFSEYQAKSEAALQRQQLKTPESDVEHAAAEAGANRLKASEAKAQAKRAKQANETSESAKFNERKRQSDQRRAKHEQQHSAKPASTVKSLPVPP